MHDLTRLMFDDGASRKPINPRSNGQYGTFVLNGRVVNWWILDKLETVLPEDGKDCTGFHLYSDKANLGSRYHLTKFVENPTEYMRDRGYRELPYNWINNNDLKREDIDFICMEYVDA